MIITIDTAKDSQQDIKRAISLLQQYISEQYAQPTQSQPTVGMNLFDMPLPSQQQTTSQSSPMGLFDIPAPTQNYQANTPQQPQAASSFLFDNILPSAQQQAQPTQVQTPTAATLQAQNVPKRVDKYILETY
ncbi:MAG TPA: hypothetical protein VK158_00875 [Acidobacteriota bacterium]|nr:hypothetical protein [Acidobacteriota bacterium]